MADVIHLAPPIARKGKTEAERAAERREIERAAFIVTHGHLYWPSVIESAWKVLRQHGVGVE